MTNDVAVKAAKGQDLYELLEHIAWTDVLKPQLEQTRKILTDQLVTATLAPSAAYAETKEQIAGKLYGINFIQNLIERVLRDGASASKYLAEQNIILK